MNDSAAAIASAFESRWIQGYVRGKLRHDPVYEAVARELRTARGPLLDVGCGVGILAHYLAVSGVGSRVIGFDFDRPKVIAARRAADRRRLAATFFIGDMRAPLRLRGSVAMLDVLHYFSDSDQERILTTMAECVAADGGVLLIRDCLRDDSWRYRVTQLQEYFSRVIGWLRGDRLNFPSRDFIFETLARAGLECVQVTPLWKRTPFNNYFLVFRRK